MAVIGLFYGSTGGSTQQVAEMLQKEWGGDAVALHDVSAADPEDLLKYDVLIFGTSTWGLGELQDGWDEFQSNLDSLDLSGKRVALFGLGDQAGYADTFLDGMGILYEKVKGMGATAVGTWPTDGYEFEQSRAVVDGKFVGLALDQDNEAHMTASRVKTWVEELKKEIA